MGAIKLRVCELVGANEIAQVITSGRNRHDQADMHAIGFHKNVDAVRRLLPFAIRGYVAADQRRHHVTSDS